MKTFWFALLSLACLLSAGCRQDPYMAAVFESMNSEKRALEDRVYELQDEHDLLEDKLESARRENTRLRQEVSGGEPAASDSGAKPRTSIFPKIPRTGAPGSKKELDSPKIDLGTPSVPGAEGAGARGPEMNGFRGAPHELPLPDGPDGAAIEPDPTDTRVTHIVLNPFLSGGHDFDRKAGDDGVAVVIEPRNSDDQFVPLAGPVSIMVVDPNVDGPEGRIARWNFDSIDAHKALKKGRFGRGISIKLPWPNEPPQHDKLKMYVRYETEDGRKLETSRDVTIAMPGQYSQRWTPRTLDGGATRSPDGTTSVLVGHTEEAPSAGRPNSPRSPTSGPAASTARRRPTWQPER